MLSLYLKHGNALSKKVVTENGFEIVSSPQQYPVLFEVMSHEQKTWWTLGRPCLCSLLLAAWPCSSSVQVGAIQTNGIADPLPSLGHVLFPGTSYSPRLLCLISHVEVQLFLRLIPLRLLWIQLKLVERERQRRMKSLFLGTQANNSGLLMTILLSPPLLQPLTIGN